MVRSRTRSAGSAAPTPTMAQAQNINLEAEAAAIKSAHQLVLGALRTTLTHVYVAGEHLSTVKAGMPDIKWADWVEQECGISESTARNYVRCYQNRATIDAMSEPMTYTAALAAIRTSRTPPPAPELTADQQALKELMEKHYIKGTLRNMMAFLVEYKEMFGDEEQQRVAQPVTAVVSR